MPSILSGCLVLLKIAMAVNDGLHSMLSSIYSIIENVLNSDRNVEPVQETDSTPIIKCSKSRILEAFNKRRANLPVCEQTEVYVSNLNPYQEITITNKDSDGRRKRSTSIVKKSQTKAVVNRPDDVRSNVEVSSPCPGNSQSSTSSLVSSDTGNESEYHSCKNMNVSVELEENNVKFCVEDEPGKTNDVLENSTEGETSIESDQPKNSSILKVLQKIKFTSQTLKGALSNGKKASMENVYGLTDSNSTDNGESTSVGVRTDSLPYSRKQFLEETARLYEDFLHDYYQPKKDTSTKLRTAPNKRGLKTEARVSNVNRPRLVGNSSAMKISLPTCLPTTTRQVNEPQQKSNLIPTITISDYSSDKTDSDCTEYRYFCNTRPISKRPAAKHINTYQLPLSLEKDKWIETDDVEHFKVEDSNKLYQITEKFKRNDASKLQIPLEQTDLNQSPVDNESIEEISSSEDDSVNSSDVPTECQPLIKPNISSHPFSSINFDYLDDLDVVSLGRVDLLKKVLQKFSATEVLEDPNVYEQQPDYQKHMFDFLHEFSDVERSHLAKCTLEASRAEEINSSKNQTNLMDLDQFQLKALNTVDKQITYLNDLTENYKKSWKAMRSKQTNIQVIENELFGSFEDRHKVMVDTIPNGYKKQLDSLTRNAGMCQDELCSTITGLKTKIGFSNLKPEVSSIENCFETCLLPQTSTSEGEMMPLVIDAFGPPDIIPRKSTSEPLELVENEEAFETIFKNKVPSLHDAGNNSGASFTLDRTRNETSTPIKGEKIDDNDWVSINLSSVSQKERSVNEGKDLISCICSSRLRTNTSLSKDPELALFDTRQELSSPHVEEDISLEAEDWGILETQMSKNYEEVVSFLNIIDGENSSAKREYNYPENKDCNLKPETVDLENISEKVLNCDSAWLEPNETSVDEDTNPTSESNSDGKKSSEILISDTNLMTMNNVQSISVRKDSDDYEVAVQMAMHQQDLVADDTCSKARDYQFINVGEDITYVINPLTNKRPNKEIAEEEISLAKFNDTGSAVIDYEIINRDLLNLFTDARATAEVKKLEMKECLRKDNFVNGNVSLKIFEKQMEAFHCLENYMKSTESNIEETELQLLKLGTDSSRYGSKFLDIKSESTSSSETEENFSDVDRGTPISNMEDLIKREELETVQIYDDFQVCDEEGNETHPGSLPEDDSNLDQITLIPNEDKTSCNKESNCTQAPGEDLESPLE